MIPNLQKLPSPSFEYAQLQYKYANYGAMPRFFTLRDRGPFEYCPIRVQYRGSIMGPAGGAIISHAGGRFKVKVVLIECHP